MLFNVGAQMNYPKHANLAWIISADMGYLCHFVIVSVMQSHCGVEYGSY